MVSFRTRDAAKLSLATLEEVGLAAEETKGYEPVPVYDQNGDKMSRFKVWKTITHKNWMLLIMICNCFLNR